MITVDNLRKYYGNVKAVDGTSFEVQEGEIFGFLGPNGAGKTTTIEMIEGYKTPDSGSVTALGFILSSLTTSPDGAVVAVHAVYIPMLLLCGAFYSLEALPKVLQVVARIFPLTYFAGPFRSVIVEGAGLAAIGGDLIILLAWAVGGWIIAIKTFRWE